MTSSSSGRGSSGSGGSSRTISQPVQSNSGSSGRDRLREESRITLPSGQREEIRIDSRIDSDGSERLRERSRITLPSGEREEIRIDSRIDSDGRERFREQSRITLPSGEREEIRIDSRIDSDGSDRLRERSRITLPSGEREEIRLDSRIDSDGSDRLRERSRITLPSGEREAIRLDSRIDSDGRERLRERSRVELPSELRGEFRLGSSQRDAGISSGRSVDAGRTDTVRSLGGISAVSDGTRVWNYGDFREFRVKTSEFNDRIIIADNKVIHRPRTTFLFVDRHHKLLHHRVIHPQFFFVTSFRFGHRHSFVSVFPFHHRRFIFVNPWGYWPHDYHYYRYYQYGYHPYVWYGPHPVPYSSYVGDTYNYYTYNYADSGTAPLPPANYAPAEPPEPTDADRYFDTAVRAFEDGDYRMAATQFALAYLEEPDDKIIPFAYVQALFAIGEYTLAAQVLNGAIARINPAEEGIFFPRGLYADEDVLLTQIEALHDYAALNPTLLHLQFLLGYQYLGLGELDYAEAPLRNATTDPVYGPKAQALLVLLENLKAARAEEAY